MQAISSYSSTSYPNDRYHSSCIVKADGKTPLVAIADLADSGDIEAWKKSLAANGDLGSASDRKEFPAGDKGKGISSSRTAAIYLKCTPAGSKLTIPLNLSITVSGISKAPSTRADIAQVALAFARYAQNSAHCTSPAALPAAPPSQLQG
ncbi:hypothetical protein [Streptomyces sp. NPDC004286]|uniref:hypothetical protein n=1 Tax=Streptomyces sp. NPDC004286 TaxID=3364696 RepID=UPI0036BF4D1C